MKTIYALVLLLATANLATAMDTHENAPYAIGRVIEESYICYTLMSPTTYTSALRETLTAHISIYKAWCRNVITDEAEMLPNPIELFHQLEGQFNELPNEPIPHAAESKKPEHKG